MRWIFDELRHAGDLVRPHRQKEAAADDEPLLHGSRPREACRARDSKDAVASVDRDEVAFPLQPDVVAEALVDHAAQTKRREEGDRLLSHPDAADDGRIIRDRSRIVEVDRVAQAGRRAGERSDNSRHERITHARKDRKEQHADRGRAADVERRGAFRRRLFDGDSGLFDAVAMAQMNQLPEEQEGEGDHERHDGDVRRCGHAGHEDQRCRQQSLRLVPPAGRLHRLIRSDEENEMRRCGDRAARDHGGVEDVEEDVRDRQATHERKRDQLRIAPGHHSDDNAGHHGVKHDQRREPDHLRSVQRNGGKHVEEEKLEL